MVRHILPPQSTSLERAVDETMPAWGHMVDAIEPTSVRADPQFQPWLAVQWQVAQFAPYFPTMEALLAEAIPWLMERGNAASLRRALGWLGFHSVVIDEDGAWLQQYAASDDYEGLADYYAARGLGWSDDAGSNSEDWPGFKSAL